MTGLTRLYGKALAHRDRDQVQAWATRYNRPVTGR